MCISVLKVARFSKVPTGALYPAECLGCPGAVGVSIAWRQALSPKSPQVPGATVENACTERMFDARDGKHRFLEHGFYGLRGTIWTSTD